MADHDELPPQKRSRVVDDVTTASEPSSHDTTSSQQSPVSTTASDKPMLPRQAQTDAREATHFPVEAFGSGVLLHAGIAVPPHSTVADLRQLVLSNVDNPPATRTIRLFAGHGGVELDLDSMLVRDTALVEDDAAKPIVLFRIMCT